MYTIKKHFSISSKEWISILITAVFAGFFLAFRDWGEETINIGTGLNNTFLSIILIFAIVTFMISIVKTVGLSLGYEIVYKHFLYGLIIGLIITFISNGRVPFFFPGYFYYKNMPRLQIGKWRPVFKSLNLFLILSSGILITTLLTLILKPLAVHTGLALFEKMFKYTLYTSWFAMMPFPVWTKIIYLRFYKNFEAATPGMDLFTYGRLGTVVFIAFLAVYTVLILTTGTTPFLIALVLALMGIFFYWRLFERTT